MAAIDFARPIFKRREPPRPPITTDDLDALQRDLEAMAQAPSVPQVAPAMPPPPAAFEPGRYPGTTGEPMPYSTTAAPPISEVERRARSVYERSPTLQPEPFDLGALARGIPRAVGQALSPILPGYEKPISMAPSPELNLPFGYQSQEEVNRAAEMVRETSEGPLGALGALPPYIGPAIAVQAARTPLQAALRIGLEAAGQPIREAPIVAGRAAVHGGEAVGRAMETTIRPIPLTSRLGRKAKLPSEGGFANPRNFGAATPEDAAWITKEGRFIAPGVDHGDSARAALGLPSDVTDEDAIWQFIERDGVIRYYNQGDNFINVDIRGPITVQQLNAVNRALKETKNQLVYDIWEPGTRRFVDSRGEGVTATIADLRGDLETHGLLTVRPGARTVQAGRKAKGIAELSPEWESRVAEGVDSIRHRKSPGSRLDYTGGEAAARERVTALERALRDPSISEVRRSEILDQELPYLQAFLSQPPPYQYGLPGTRTPAGGTFTSGRPVRARPSIGERAEQAGFDVEGQPVTVPFESEVRPELLPQTVEGIQQRLPLGEDFYKAPGLSLQEEELLTRAVKQGDRRTIQRLTRKGQGQLMEERLPYSANGQYELSPDAITTNPLHQPRKGLDEANVQRIVENYDPNRFLPVEVREINPGVFELIHGHHRLEAARRLALKRIPVRVLNVSSEDAIRLAEEANLAGQPLKPTEIARLLDKRLRQAQSPVEIVRDFPGAGIRAGQVEDYARIVNLPRTILEAVDDPVIGRQFTVQHAMRLAKAQHKYSMPADEVQAFFNEVIMKQEMTPAQMERVLDNFAPVLRKESESQGALFGGGDFQGTYTGIMATIRGAVGDIKSLESLERRMKGIVSFIEAGKEVPAELAAARGPLERQIAGIRQRIVQAQKAVTGEIHAERGGQPPTGGGARKLTQQELQDALLGPQGAGAQPTVGLRTPQGNIVGAQPSPPTPTPGQAPTPQPLKEFWARPLANLEMIAGAFKDNFWRSAAQRTGLKQFTSIIDPAALVSGTATDPVSITGRSLLLRNRVLDVGDSGVNGGMAWLREKPNPFNIGGDARISSLPGKPMWDAVFDSPGRFKLTPEQTDYVKLYQDMGDDALALAKQNGIPIRELTLGADRHYIPRLVEAIRGIENEKAGRVGGRIGAKAGFQKTRFYEWSEEGVAKGVVYSNDPLTVMEHHVQSIYRLIADKRLADEMAPLGETILERVEKKAPGLFAAREISKKEFIRARELLSAVNRAYRGERLPPALVASIGRSFPNEAAALKVAGPNSPALQPIEQAARTLMAQHRSNWKDISLKMNRVKDAVQPGFDEGWIPQPFAQGRIFPKEVVQAVQQATGDVGNAWLKAVQVPSVISRTIGTTIDFGAPFIQGLGVLGENPGAWARATLKHYQAFLDPAAKQRYFIQNAEAVKEMAQYGAGVGTTEFFAGNRPITGAFKLLPEEVSNVTTWMGKQSVGRFQEAFGTFLDVSGVEMWKGLRGRALQEGPDSLFALADYVSHARGTMSQRTIGIGVSQQQIESGLMMFAPRYTKAGFALFTDVATLPTYLKGNALRANLSAIIGSAVTYYLAGATALNALGLMKSEEVQERLNPIKNGRFNSKFLTLPIGTDNVGMGSFGYSMLRLLAGTTDKAINEPGDLLKLDAQDNPIMGFFRSRLVGGAPAASLAIELFTGRNYFGEKFDQPADYAVAVAQRLLPFWAEAYIGHIPAFQERDLFQQPPASLEALPAAFAGQRVFPQSYGTRAAQLEKQLASERGWTLPLNRDQRRQLEATNPELAKLKGQAETQSDKFAKGEVQQQTADYFSDVDKSKVLRERSLEAPYRGFLNGKLSGKDLLDIRSDASTEMAGAIALGREKYPLALVDRAAREAYYGANRIEIKEGNPDDIAAEGYYSIRVPTGEEGKDFDAFFKAREDYLKQFTPEVRNYITKVYSNKRFEQEWMNKLELEIQADMETLRPYWEARDVVMAQSPKWARARQKHDALANNLEEQKKFDYYDTDWREYQRQLDLEQYRLRANASNGIQAAGLKWEYFTTEPEYPGPKPPEPPRAPRPPLPPLAPQQSTTPAVPTSFGERPLAAPRTRIPAGVGR